MSNNSDGLRGVPTISPAQMSDWEEICKAFAKEIGAELLFVNNTSCGVQFPNGNMKHIYVEEMQSYFEEKGKKTEAEGVPIIDDKKDSGLLTEE